MKLLLIVTVVFTGYMQSAVAIDFPVEHSWTESEKALLKTLWIEKLKEQKDITNRVDNNPVAISMGHNIFFDKRFSSNKKVACASCHHPDKYFTDGLDTAQGIKKVNRNAPTIVGSSQHSWFFLDGRSDSLWSQALGPLENELEHDTNRTQVAHIIYNDPYLRESYEKLFGKMPVISNKKHFPEHAGPVKNIKANQAWKSMHKKDKQVITNIFVNVGKVIAAYEARLQPGTSRFDYYVKALLENNIVEMQKQLSTKEANGLRIFAVKAKCTVCHSGPMFTDKGFHNISVPKRDGYKHDWGRYNGSREVLKNPFNCRSQYNDSKDKSCDELEYIVMERHETQGAMKTPSLRNVAKTAPYMHAGQFKSLKEVIEHYDNPPPVTFRQSELFLDFNLNDKEVDALVAFLKTLNSPIKAKPDLLRPPVLN